MVYDVLIVGAGAAGLMAAASINEKAKVLVLESNNTPGKKLLLTGGNRCNFTHIDEPSELLKAFGENSRFLKYALYDFSPKKTIEFFQNCGVTYKVENDGCVFPLNDNSESILAAIYDKVINNGVEIEFSSTVSLLKNNGYIFEVSANTGTYYSKNLIFATGGLSYPKTGSTGDGYKFAKNFGHTINQPLPSLVPLITREKFTSKLAGVSLKNVKVTLSSNNKLLVLSGDLLFTHNGLSGPVILNLSKEITKVINLNKNSVTIFIDFLPQIDAKEFDNYLLNQSKLHPRRNFLNCLEFFLPSSLLRAILERNQLSPDKKNNQITKDERKKALKAVKESSFTIVQTYPISSATVTQGGIDVKDINDKTMESKLKKGLFFAGEIIDVDGHCGGYNLQMCWSTGRLAGLNASKI